MSKLKFEKNIVIFIVILISFVVVLVAVFGEKGLFDLYKLHNEEVVLQENLGQLKKQKQEWIEKITILKTNKNSIKNLAREKLGLINRNETVLLLPKKLKE